MRVIIILAAATAVAALVAAPAGAAAPNYILVSGSGLERPVVLSNWGENLRLFSAAVLGRSARGDNAILRGLRDRPRLRLFHFWAWSGKPVPIDARGANGQGAFYPAHGTVPAVIVLGSNSGARLASPRLLEILKRHGISTRL